MTWKAIAALAENRVIGAHGKIPWRLPDDLRFFREQTTGHTVLMGRKTWESLGRPLPGRRNVIVSRTLTPGAESVPGAIVVPDLNAAAALPPMGDVWVIGGAEIYALALPRCEELFLTEVAGQPPGDTFFPPFEHLFIPAEILRETIAYRMMRFVRRK